mgnify:CR=1 FL=1
MTPDERIADLEARLAMLTQEVRLFLSGAAPADRGKLFTHQDVQQLSYALRADAPAVAAFTARIESQGAAKELRLMADHFSESGLPGSLTLLDRAAELEADEG